MPVSEKEKQVLSLIKYAKEHYPLIAPLVNSRLHHIKAKYAGVIAIAIGACELLALVLG